VEHHICVSHLPRLANPGTSQQMEDHQADIKVPHDLVISSVPDP
jgi:hypothetical protein